MITFYGDPHGIFDPLLDECRRRKSSHAVIVGDFDLEEPFKTVLAPLLQMGVCCWWIPGNHDGDRPHWYGNLTDHAAECSIDGRVVEMNGVRVAGLGGVYRGKIWHPNTGEPNYRSREEFIRNVNKSERWKGGLPLRHRVTIFPEDHERLSAMRTDILVTHEAPGVFEKGGIAAIDDLAEEMGAKLIIHGHHHTAYCAKTAGGVMVRGLALAEPCTIDPETLTEV